MGAGTCPATRRILGRSTGAEGGELWRARVRHGAGAEIQAVCRVIGKFRRCSRRGKHIRTDTVGEQPSSTYADALEPLSSLGSSAEASRPCHQHSGPSGDRQPQLAAAATRPSDRIRGMIMSVIIGSRPDT